MDEARLNESDLIGPAAELWRSLTIDERHAFRLAFAVLFANPTWVGSYKEGRITIKGLGSIKTYKLRIGYVSFKMFFVGNVPFVYEMGMEPEIYAPEETTGTFMC